MVHLDRRSCILSARNGRVAVRCLIAGGVAVGRGAAVRSRRSGLRFSCKTRLRLQPALPRQSLWLRARVSPTPANPLSSLTALPVPPLDPSPIRKRHQTFRLLFVLRLWYHSFHLKVLLFAGAKAVSEGWIFSHEKTDKVQERTLWRLLLMQK